LPRCRGGAGGGINSIVDLRVPNPRSNAREQCQIAGGGAGGVVVFGGCEYVCAKNPLAVIKRKIAQ